MRKLFEKLEPIGECESGWQRLKWKAIRHRGFDNPGTWNVFTSKRPKDYRQFKFQWDCHRVGHYGYGLTRKGFILDLYYFSIWCWVHYNLSCCDEGPVDNEDHGKPMPWVAQ